MNMGRGCLTMIVQTLGALWLVIYGPGWVDAHPTVLGINTWAVIAGIVILYLCVRSEWFARLLGRWLGGHHR